MNVVSGVAAEASRTVGAVQARKSAAPRRSCRPAARNCARAGPRAGGRVPGRERPSPKSTTSSSRTRWPPSSSSPASRWRCSSSGGCCPSSTAGSSSPAAPLRWVDVIIALRGGRHGPERGRPDPHARLRPRWRRTDDLLHGRLHRRRAGVRAPHDRPARRARVGDRRSRRARRGDLTASSSIGPAHNHRPVPRQSGCSVKARAGNDCHTATGIACPIGLGVEARPVCPCGDRLPSLRGDREAPGYWPTRVRSQSRFVMVGLELLLAPAFLWPAADVQFASCVLRRAVPRGVVHRVCRDEPRQPGPNGPRLSGSTRRALAVAVPPPLSRFRSASAVGRRWPARPDSVAIARGHDQGGPAWREPLAPRDTLGPRLTCGSPRHRCRTGGATRWPNTRTPSWSAARCRR